MAIRVVNTGGVARAVAAGVLACWSMSAGPALAGTRLIELVKGGDRAAVRAWVRAHPGDVNEAEADGTTPLHWAVRSDDLEVVRMLLAAGASPNAVNRQRVPPLLPAVTNGNAEMVQTLVAAGADVNTPLTGGQTLLMMAARIGDVKTVDLLLARGADANAVEEALGESALMWAAAENHDDAVRALVAGGAHVDARSKEMAFSRDRFGDGKSARFTVLPRGGWTPLMYAARQDASRAVGALAAAGADLNATDPDGTTALTLAVINAHYDVAVLLLRAGADPNVSDATGMTPLYAAVDMHTLDETPGRPAPTPSGDHDAASLVPLLLARGARVDAPLRRPILERVHNNGDGALGAGATPLMRAARKGDVALIRLLLERGADPRARTGRGATALLYLSGFGGQIRFAEYDARRATEQEFLEGMRLCLEHGSDINEANDAGQTPLHLAVVSREDVTVQFLLERGARVDAPDMQGRTPLDIARGAGGRGRGDAPRPRASTIALLERFAGSRGDTGSTGVGQSQ